MDFRDLISRNGIVPALRAKTKKQVIEDLSAIAAKQAGIETRDVFDTLLRRERLGSTGVGRGIAIPHARMTSVTSMICVFARLTERIPFDSPDNEPVDLVFLLLAPEHAGADHLKALACISRLVRDPAMADRFAILSDPLASNAA
jgi:nitrogen PTS system EIIA component